MTREFSVPFCSLLSCRFYQRQYTSEVRALRFPSECQRPRISDHREQHTKTTESTMLAGSYIEERTELGAERDTKLTILEQINCPSPVASLRFSIKHFFLQMALHLKLISLTPSRSAGGPSYTVHKSSGRCLGYCKLSVSNRQDRELITSKEDRVERELFWWCNRRRDSSVAQ